MARANVVTLLSLDRYAEIIGTDPRHFNQMITSAFPADGACDDIWWQYAWQSPDKAAREDLALAISQAEMMIAQYLGWWPAPHWLADERVDFPVHRSVVGGRTQIMNFALRENRYKTVRTRGRKVEAGGRKTWSLLKANVVVTYSDPYGLLFKDLAAVNFAYDATAHADLLGSEVRLVPKDTPVQDLDRYQIRGLRTTLTAPATVDAEGLSAKFVDPDLWEKPEAIEGDTIGNFVTHVDAYRLWTSDDGTANAAVLLGWEDPTVCVGSDVAACAVETSYACMMLVNPRSGIVAPIPATWGAASTWVRTSLCREPDRLRLWYRAGHPAEERGEMSPPMDRAVAALATALLAKPVCGCDRAEKLTGFWQAVPSDPSFKQLEAPFGPENGAYQAYLSVAQETPLGGISLG